MRNDRAETLCDGKATPSILGQRLAPSGFVRGEFQRGQVPRFVLQQRGAILQRIALGLMRQFIDERLREKAVPRSFHAAPGSGRNVRLYLYGAIVLIGDSVEDVRLFVWILIGGVVVYPHRRRAVRG